MTLFRFPPRIMVLQGGRSTSTGKSSEARSANGLNWSRVSSQARIKIPCPAPPAALSTIPRCQPLAAQPLDREAAPPPHIQRRQAPPGELWWETLSAARSPNPQEAARGAAMTAAGWGPDGDLALEVMRDQLQRALQLCPHREDDTGTPEIRTQSTNIQDRIPW